MLDKAQLLAKLSQYTLLLVDDDIALMAVLQRTYKRYFKDVYLAYNGIDGIQSYQENCPHIVIPDISMPQCDGLEMAKTIMSLDKNLKIIFVTGHNDEELLMQLECFGGHTITKPVDIQNLFMLVAKVLNS